MKEEDVIALSRPDPSGVSGCLADVAEDWVRGEGNKCHNACFEEFEK